MFYIRHDNLCFTSKFFKELDTKVRVFLSLLREVLREENVWDLETRMAGD